MSLEMSFVSQAFALKCIIDIVDLTSITYCTGIHNTYLFLLRRWVENGRDTVVSPLPDPSWQ